MNNNQVHQAQSSKGNILVVDDRPDNLRLLSAMLTQRGYEVRKVLNGQTALKTEQLLTMSVQDIDLDFSTATWHSHWQELKQRGSFTFESTHKTKEGRNISVEITVNYLEFNAQEYNCAIARDITVRKQAETALARSEAKFRNLFENSLVGIFRTRIQDGLILEANQRFIQMLGYSDAADIINQKFATDFYVDLGDRQLMLAELQAKGQVHNFETQLRKRDGLVIWVLFSARMNVEEDCLEGVITDIARSP